MSVWRWSASTLTGVLVWTALAAGPAAGAPSQPSRYEDVPTSHWAHAAIENVAVANNWMRVSGSRFLPSRLLSRKHLVVALVRAFAPKDPADRSVSFTDVPESSPYFRFASIAVARRWLPANKDGSFGPDSPVQKRTLDRALVNAAGLTPVASAINRISAGGVALKRSTDLGYLQVGALLRLHHNHPSPSDEPDLLPTSNVTRADGAYALWRARTISSSTRASLERYRSLDLPELSDQHRAVVEFALRWVGYPYVYAGEWHRPVASGYCCGQQAQGGFDCSGWAWWTVASPQSGWDNTRVRPYEGWTVPERSSARMAEATTERLTADRIEPLDLLFFDTNGKGDDWAATDHVGVALGNGYMMHSSGSRAGVAIEWIGDGWWSERFLWARRIATTPG